MKVDHVRIQTVNVENRHIKITKCFCVRLEMESFWNILVEQPSIQLYRWILLFIYLYTTYNNQQLQQIQFKPWT